MDEKGRQVEGGDDQGWFEAEKVRMEEITTWLKGDERNRYLETLKPAWSGMITQGWAEAEGRLCEED